MNLDWLVVVPFFVAAIMSHLGVNFTQENYDGFERKEKE